MVRITISMREGDMPDLVCFVMVGDREFTSNP